MNIIFYLFSRDYKKHHWATRHLQEYRHKPLWLWYRKLGRVISNPLVMSKIVEQEYSILRGGTIIIPKIHNVAVKPLIEGD